MAQFQAAAWAIRSAFRIRRMAQDIRAELIAAFRETAAPLVAVRSSATNEDSPTRSFIGQHVSVLGVDSEDAAVDAALESWASLFSAKALAYAQRFGTDLVTSRMGLVLQPMISPEIRGALFTADPITGDPDRFILEIHQGPEQGVFDLDPYGRKPGEQSYWSQLRYYGLLLDEHDLEYQAIEWAIHRGELSFLRVRPATAVPPFVPPRELPTSADVDLALVDVGNVSPRALRPWSRYHLSRIGLGAGLHLAVNGEAASGDRVARAQVCGYLYRQRSRLDVRRSADTGSITLVAQSLRAIAASARADQDASALLDTHWAWLASISSTAPDSLTDAELAGLLAHLRSTGDALYAQCVRQDEAMSALLAALERVYREWAQIDRPDDPVLERLHASAARLLLTTGVDTAAPLWESVDVMLWSSGEAPSSPDVALEVEPAVRIRLSRWQRSTYASLVEKVRESQGLNAQVFAAARLCRSREREAILDAGRRLHAVGVASEAHDAALLEANELDRWLRGVIQDEQVVRWIMRRREEVRRAWRYSPPARLGVINDRSELDMTQCDVVLRGRPVSPGRVVGRARIVGDLGQSAALVPGEVLVCHEATYELSLVFGAVAAIVAESGTLLDQSAVLAREYGVPAVFSVPNVCHILANGDELLVDATRGVVGRSRPAGALARSALGQLMDYDSWED